MCVTVKRINILRIIRSYLLIIPIILIQVAGNRKVIMVYGVILASGRGTRMGGNIPKQYLELNGKPIFMWTLERFLNSNLFEKIYLTTDVNWCDFTQKILMKYLSLESLKKIEFCVTYSKNRTLCLKEIIDIISKENGTSPNDIIVSHDAVRPFVSYKILKDGIVKAMEFQVAMAAVPCAETFYLSDMEEFLIKSQDRTNCYLGQSPHSCNLQLLNNILNSYSKEELEKTAAISQLFINKNINVKMSHGEETNFKITTPKDLAFAKFYAEHFGTEDNSDLEKMNHHLDI